MTERIVEKQEAWDIFRQAGVDSRKVDQLNSKFQLFYRSSEYTRRDEWLPAKLSWCVYRTHNEKGEPKCTTECSIRLQGIYESYPPWFIWCGKFGEGQLVLINRNKKQSQLIGYEQLLQRLRRDPRIWSEDSDGRVTSLLSKVKQKVIRLRQELRTDDRSVGPYSGLTSEELRASGTCEPDWF